MPGRGFVKVLIDGVFRHAVVHKHDVDRADVAIILVIKIGIADNANRVPVLVQYRPNTLPILPQLVFVSPIGHLRRLRGTS